MKKIMKFKNGNVYEGEWKNDVKYGLGVNTLIHF